MKKIFYKTFIIMMLFLILLSSCNFANAATYSSIFNRWKNSKTTSITTKSQTTNTKETKYNNSMDEGNRIIDKYLTLIKNNPYIKLEVKNSSEIKKYLLKQMFFYMAKNTTLSNYISTDDDDLQTVFDAIYSISYEKVDWTNPKVLKTAYEQLLLALTNTTDLSKKMDTDILNNINFKGGNEFNELSDFMELTYSYDEEIGESFTESSPIGISRVYVESTDYTGYAYLVAIQGTNFAENQANGVITDVLVGCEVNNIYLQSAIAAVKDGINKIEETLPESEKGNKNIIIGGVSLGGMLSEQLMVQPEIYTNYNILKVISIGSPLLMTDERIDETEYNGQIVKFSDYVDKENVCRFIYKYDIVTYLCLDYFLKADYYEKDQIPYEGRIYEKLIINDNPNFEENVAGNGFIAHMYDCVMNSLWDGYDILGNKNGNSKITIVSDTIKYDSEALFNGKLSMIE